MRVERREIQKRGNDPPSQRESLTHLYNEKALRYGIVFDELIRQVAVHSMDLATLVGKVCSLGIAYVFGCLALHSLLIRLPLQAREPHSLPPKSSRLLDLQLWLFLLVAL